MVEHQVIMAFINLGKAAAAFVVGVLLYSFISGDNK